MAVSLSQTAAGSDDTSSQTTITLSSKSIGTAASDRLIFFGVTTDGGVRTAVSVTSVTIGGISAASTGAAYNPTSLTNARMQFWWALVSSGTTASVVVNFNGPCDSTAEIDWALYRVVGADTASPLSGSPVTATGTSPINGSLTIPTNGCGIAAGKSNSGSAFTWTNLTEDTDASGAMTGRRYTFASSTSAGTATRTLTGGAGQGEGLYMIAIAEAVDTLAPQQLRFM